MKHSVRSHRIPLIVKLYWEANKRKECRYACPYRSVHLDRDIRGAVYHVATRRAVTSSNLVTDCYRYPFLAQPG